MKYYVIDIETYNDGTSPNKAIYEYDTSDEAVASFHSRMGSAMKNPNVDTVLVSAINAEGALCDQSYWKRPVEEESQ